MKKKTELLAPAGNYECLRAVLASGADAAYAGGPLFGARAYAANFGQDELLEAIREVHVLGKKLYLTVNTLLKNKELYGELYDYLGPLYDAGLDAVLVQDFGVLSFLRRHFPSLPIHASTQMTVTGKEGMRFLATAGVTRVVAARELSLEEIRSMHAASDFEIETFIHGALCYCYSGRCLMSSMIGGRSGNRGRCAQPCRLPYEVLPFEKGDFRNPSVRRRKKDSPRENSTGFTPLSMKDMNTIDILPEIVEAGAASLKIEGRMKQKEYAAGVTEIYRKYLDLIEADGFRRENYHLSEEDRRRLNELFSRGGSCTGYYQSYHGKNMIDFYGSKKTGEISVSIEEPKEKISGKLTLAAEEPVTLSLRCRETAVTMQGDAPEPASGRPVTEQDVLSKLSRLGGTVFEWENLDIEIEDGLFLPMKELNELRRNAVAELYNAVAAGYGRSDRKPRHSLENADAYKTPETEKTPATESHPKTENLQEAEKPAPTEKTPSAEPQPSQRMNLSASCEDEKTAELLLNEEDLCRLYIPLRIFDHVLARKKELEAAGRYAGKTAPSLFIALPMISRRAPEDFIEVLQDALQKGASGFLVRDPEMLFTLCAAGLSGCTVCDASIYTWNDEASAFLKGLGILQNTVPLELNEREIRHRDNAESEMLVYGYLPLMISSQCVRSNCSGGKSGMSCTGCRDRALLADRLGNRFPVQCECTPWKGEDTEKNTACYNIIYNSLPFGLPDESRKVSDCGIRSVRLSFTVEKPEEALRTFREYRGIYLYGKAPEQAGKVTKGHFKRGAL